MGVKYRKCAFFPFLSSHPSNSQTYPFSEYRCNLTFGIASNVFVFIFLRRLLPGRVTVTLKKSAPWFDDTSFGADPFLHTGITMFGNAKWDPRKLHLTPLKRDLIRDSSSSIKGLLTLLFQMISLLTSAGLRLTCASEGV